MDQHHGAPMVMFPDATTLYSLTNNKEPDCFPSNLDMSARKGMTIGAP